jgi:hypothetical protein
MPVWFAMILKPCTEPLENNCPPRPHHPLVPSKSWCPSGSSSALAHSSLSAEELAEGRELASEVVSLEADSEVTCEFAVRFTKTTAT